MRKIFFAYLFIWRPFDSAARAATPLVLLLFPATPLLYLAPQFRIIARVEVWGVATPSCRSCCYQNSPQTTYKCQLLKQVIRNCARIRVSIAVNLLPEKISSICGRSPRHTAPHLSSCSDALRMDLGFAADLYRLC